MSDIEFMPDDFDPGNTRSNKPGRDKWGLHEFCSALRENRGKWAALASVDGAKAPIPGNVAAVIREGRSKASRPPGSFEAVCSGGKVYARFVGDSDE